MNIKGYSFNIQAFEDKNNGTIDIKSEKGKGKVAFRGGEKHFYIEKHRKL